MADRNLSPVRLIGGAVFAFVFVFEHGEVRLITAFGDVVILECLQHSTSRLMGVGTVGETAILGKLEDLLEIAGQLLGFNIEGSETLDTRCINEPAQIRGEGGGVRGERYHLTKRCGMLAGVMGIGNLGSALRGARNQAIDECGLPHPTITAQQSDFAFEQLTQHIDTLTRLGRHLMTSIANSLVEVDHRILIATQIIIQEIGLIEHQDHWDTIGLSRSQESVDKRGGGLGIHHRDYQQGLVDIRSQNMALFGKINTFSNNVVLAIFNFRYPVPLTDRNPVAYSYRVSRADSLESKISFDFRLNQLAIVG